MIAAALTPFASVPRLLGVAGERGQTQEEPASAAARDILMQAQEEPSMYVLVD